MKKFLKILGITLLIILLLLIVIPFAFQSQIKDMVKDSINQNLNAKVEFADVNLSFIRDFPQANVIVDDLLITNYEPFEDETFLSAKNIAFSMSIKELFKNTSEEPIVINSIDIDEALLTLKTDALGNNNYDITKVGDTTSTATANNEASNNFTFDIEKYVLNNSALTYIDQISKTTMYITELNHNGKGTFSTETSQLDTHTDANVSMNIDSIQYLDRNKVKLDALIGLDLDNQKYTFMDNKGFINKLPLHFEGYVQIIEEGQDIDITFENPESSFKDFLAVIPESYSKNIENVETSGDFKVNGTIKGKVTETLIPTLNIGISSNNASFKYPDLPKSVSNITIDTKIMNETGNVDDTYVDIKTLNFKIDQDVFRSSATIKNLTGNMLVKAVIDGTLNLGNLAKAYPIDLDKELSGIFKAQLNTSFDMNAVEQNAYERINANGNLSLSDVVFSSDALANPVQISKAEMKFNPKTVALNSFKAKTGRSDISATGTINNLLGFVLSDKKLKGDFNLNSNNFALADIMVQDAENTPSESTEENTKSKSEPTNSTMKIPDFLDCSIKANAKTVVYDNLTLKNVSGILSVKDETAELENLTSDIFDGVLAVKGKVSTKTNTPTFDMNLGADGFDIASSFQQMELLQSLAPIATVLDGKLNTIISLKGSLTEELTPNLSSVSGSALAELLTTDINQDQSSLLGKLDGAINFIDFSNLNLNDLNVNLNFADGQVKVKPFNFNYKDIDIVVSGAHGFDKSLSYSAVLDVPAKYLGSEINRLIGKINDSEVNNLTIPVTANIGGTVTSPTVKTDLTSGVSNLTKQLVEIQKQKLVGQGKDKVNDLLGGLLGGTEQTSKQDSTAIKTDTTKIGSEPVKESVKNILGGLLGKRKKQSDSTKNQP